MKELNREDCERIYGCGINIAPALRGLGEFGEDFAHGAEGDSAGRCPWIV